MKKLKPLTLPLISFAAGIGTVFSFSPFSFWPLQLACFAVLAGVILHADSLKKAFFSGWAYSAAGMASGLYWMFISLHVYGGLNAFLAVLSIFLLALALGIQAGFACLLSRLCMNRWQTGKAVSSMLVFPAFWTFFEWVRGWFCTGLPWLSAGYAHTGSPLSGYAPVFGVFGVSFAATAASGAIAFFFCSSREKWKMSLASAVLVAGGIFGAGGLLSLTNWTAAEGMPVKVRLIQGNIAQEFKFSPDQIKDSLDIYARLITKEPADLIVTPETAIPVYPQMLPEGYLDSLAEFSGKTRSSVALGMPIADSMTVYTNSIAVLTPEEPGMPGNFTYRYDKHHLVPFGEFIPTGFKWFVRLMRIPLGDFTRGDPLQKPFTVGGQRILPNICYEDIFGEEIAAQIRNEIQAGSPAPTVLLNISNIAWFGNTVALPQHLQISQMRAIETGRPMLRATNTGATAVIDEKGRVTAMLSPYTRDEIKANIQGRSGSTPYIRFGNGAVLFAILAALIASWLLSRRKRRSS